MAGLLLLHNPMPGACDSSPLMAAGNPIEVCESDRLGQYECPVGTDCEVVADELGCFCDDIADGDVPTRHA